MPQYNLEKKFICCSVTICCSSCCSVNIRQYTPTTQPQQLNTAITLWAATHPLASFCQVPLPATQLIKHCGCHWQLILHCAGPVGSNDGTRLQRPHATNTFLPLHRMHV